MKRLLAVLLAIVLGFALAGCGSTPSQSKLSTSALLKKARAYVTAQKDISLSGRIDQAGAETSLDLKYSGDDAYGTIKLSGATIAIESIGGKTWFKPSTSFWAQQLKKDQANMVANLIGDHWIIADPTNANFAQLITLAKRSFLTKEVLTPEGTITKGKVTTVSGTKAIPLTLKSGSIYLADEDARPLQIKGSSGGDSGTATFSYDKVTVPAAPKDAVDLTKLLSATK